MSPVRVQIAATEPCKLRGKGLSVHKLDAARKKGEDILVRVL